MAKSKRMDTPQASAPKESISDLFKTQAIPPKPQEPPKVPEAIKK